MAVMFFFPDKIYLNIQNTFSGIPGLQIKRKSLKKPQCYPLEALRDFSIMMRDTAVKLEMYAGWLLNKISRSVMQSREKRVPIKKSVCCVILERNIKSLLEWV